MGGHEGTARGLTRTKGRECREQREEDRPCLQSPGCWWCLAGALSKLTLRELGRLPDHCPSLGGHPGALGWQLLPGKLLPLSLDPFPPHPGFCRQWWQQPLLHEPSSHFCQLVGARCPLSIQPVASVMVLVFATSAPSPFSWTGELGVPVGCSQPPARP